MSRANRKPHVRKKNLTTLDQWIEVEVRDGVTVTSFYPPNDEILRLAVNMDKEPEMIYRRLFFVLGIPREYAWITDDPQKIANGGACILRFRFVDWVAHIKTETEGHLEPFRFLLPRPEERGGCDCPGCTAAAERILREGY